MEANAAVGSRKKKPTIQNNLYLSKNQFIKLVTQELNRFLKELPLDLRIQAEKVCVQVKEKPKWKELFRLGVVKLFAYIDPRWNIIRIFRIPILETTQPEKIQEAIRGILEHEFAHLFGLTDEEAWKAASKGD